MTYNHDFGYSFPLFSSLLKKGKKKRRISRHFFDFKSCLSAQSIKISQTSLIFFIFCPFIGTIRKKYHLTEYPIEYLF